MREWAQLSDVQKISICMLTYERPSALKNSVMSLLAQIRSSVNAKEISVDFEIFNNGSRLELEQLTIDQQFEPVKITNHASNLGLMGNFFYAVDNCRADWLWIVSDDDCLYLKNVLQELSKRPLEDLLVFQRLSREGFVIQENLLQRNIGLSANVFRTEAAKEALAKIRMHGLYNNTYPQVLLSQCIKSVRSVDSAAFQDQQPEKNYALESKLNVVIRDVLLLNSSAEILGSSSEVLVLVRALAVSHLFHYSLEFFHPKTPNEDKKKLLGLLKSLEKTSKGRVRIVAFSVIQGLRISLVNQALAFNCLRGFLLLLGKSHLVPRESTQRYATVESRYFGYDPE